MLDRYRCMLILMIDHMLCFSMYNAYYTIFSCMGHNLVKGVQNQISSFSILGYFIYRLT